MRFRSLITFASAAIIVAALAAAAAAQVIQASGTVQLTQADGTKVPLAGATVKFFRTDIKQEFSTKTDKNGHYVHAGIPLVGTYTIAFSAPGATPFYLNNVRINGSPQNDVTLAPGDGHVLTLEEIRAAATRGGAGAAATAAPADSAEAKKKAAEIEAERKRIESENAKASEVNTKLPEIMKAGNEAFNAKNFDLAIAKYDEGLALDARQPNFLRNKTIVLLERGRDKYNAGLKNKDAAGKDAGRADFKAATEAAEQAVAVKRELKGAGGGAAAPGQANDDLPFLSTRFDAYRLALQTSAPVDNDAAAKAIEEYINAETDPVKKDKAQSSLGDALFFAGKIDESVAKFREVLARNPNNLDAIYGLGIALAAKVTDATKDAAILEEAHDTLQQFVAKAPEGYARKQEAADSVRYLEETMKSTANNKASDSKSKPAARRKP
ncbi:MAG TPA: carboxypeptidase regulatory-like domain-containing protein [Pyrinomonadaceae bacterium]|jgi:tetratricopeptide (TPR) repeat protein